MTTATLGINNNTLNEQQDEEDESILDIMEAGSHDHISISNDDKRRDKPSSSDDSQDANLFKHDSRKLRLFSFAYLASLVLAGITLAIVVNVWMNENSCARDENESNKNNAALILTLVIAAVFLALAVAFVIFWNMVERRQCRVLQHSMRSNAMLSSLFPSAMRDRLMEDRCENDRGGNDRGGGEYHDKNSNKSSEQYKSNSNNSKTMPISPGRTTDSSDHDSSLVDPSSSSGGDKAYIREPSRLKLKLYLRAESPSPAPDTSNLSGSLPRFSPTFDAKPIADFFPKCTVLFADISGFTAWSSQREPAQVFTLLQNLYGVFDYQARRMEVYKVEAIGDCYVAVTGLPDPQEEHAVVMAKFSMECRNLMRRVTRQLVQTLGPETEDLSMRFGLHSGPVTAGVLRGERSRFQLFGDTVNTAARMESTGEPGRIQISEATASLLQQAGKGSLLLPREELVSVKGKGCMRTFWLADTNPRSIRITSGHRSRGGGGFGGSSSTATGGSSVISFGMFESTSDHDTLTLSDKCLLDDGDSDDGDSNKKGGRTFTPPFSPSSSRGRPLLAKVKTPIRGSMWGSSQDMESLQATCAPPKLKRNTSSSTGRLIEWNTGMLLRLLKRVVAQRQYNGVQRELVNEKLDTKTENGQKKMVLDEINETITMPRDAVVPADEQTVEIDFDVEVQLREYVAVIASMYRDNPFHSFAHACHVQQSLVKLLERVVTPDQIDYDAETATIASDAHNYTYGIASDPLTQFTVAFCALIHDVDHTGVSNSQLVREKALIATEYHNKSVAEQHSIDLAWDLLMQEDYKDLRACIYATNAEFKRFRQLVVNTVLATDIFDQELSALRKNRWQKAFSYPPPEESSMEAANRKATIVIEHLIQASDVSHTMQHWEIYQKWNEKLFYEMYLAFKSGRADSDPSPGWFKGELWFFDNYVIPLAKKLADCGVFGVSSDECLNYAMENRRMWELHGQEIVARMLATDYYAKIKEEQQHSASRRNRGGRRKKTLQVEGSREMMMTRRASDSNLSQGSERLGGVVSAQI